MFTKLGRKPAERALTTLIAAVAISAVASAEENPKPSTGALAEIVVTATRRAENIQNVPITMSAFTSDMLKDAGVTDTSQLGDVTPSVVIAKSTVIFTPTIRGISCRALLMSDECNIGLYVDGVYQAEPYAGTVDLMEVERVEVLRGPQGTLFGRNSTGGLINIITKTPSYEPSGHIELTYGRYYERDSKFYYTAGLSDSVAADIALMTKNSDGFVKDLAHGGTRGGHENYAARSKLLMDWTADTRAILTIGASKQSDQLPNAVVTINGNTAGNVYGVSPVATEAWTTATSTDTEAIVTQYNANLQTTTKFSNFDLETTASWQHNRLFALSDSDASLAQVQQVNSNSAGNDYTVEVRVLSDNDSKLKWIGGLFGIYREGSYDPLGIQRGSDPADPNSPIVTLLDIYNDFKTKSIAGFAEGTYAFNKQWSLTAGARYTWEYRWFKNVKPSNFDDDKTFNEVTPKLSLQYFYSDNGNIYATYSRGFKSGVFNGSTSSPPAVVVKPEEVDSYEVGIKAEPTSWLRANAAVYYYKYKDIQLSQFDTASGFVKLSNAATSTIKGFEFEVFANLIDNLDLHLGGNVMKAKFDDYKGAPSTQIKYDSNGVPIGNTAITIDSSGLAMIRAPDWTFNLGVNYDIPLKNSLLSLQSHVLWTDRYFFTTDERFAQPSYAKVGAQVSWSPASEKFKISLWGENLTNKQIKGHVVSGTTSDYTWYEPPLTYGIRGDFKF